MMSAITKVTAEEAAQHRLSEVGYQVEHEPELLLGERSNFKQVVLVGRLRAAVKEKLGPSDKELAFYDALVAVESASEVLEDVTLRAIARDLARTVRQNATIDWTLKETSRAKLRTVVKRTLRKHGFPAVEQEQATIIVLQQAELFSRDWAA